MQDVEIRVQGQIDPTWSEWLGDLKISHVGENQTLLTGSIVDQSALYGILTHLRDLGLSLISVNVADSQHTIRRRDVPSDETKVLYTEENHEKEQSPHH